MAQHLRLARLFFVLLAIFTIGRLSMSAVPYEKGHQVFSLVTLTVLSAVYYGAFCRRWRGYPILGAVALAGLLGFSAQLVILIATLSSYVLGVQTYFIHPTALNVTEPVPLGRALVIRASGLVFNTIFTAMLGALGWALGGLLPAEQPKA